MHDPKNNFPENFSGFQLRREEEVPELRSRALIFTHEKTGARLLHLFNEDPNNLFSIAFRTPVFNNTGVPHILEHSVLCGSRKFPIKDPFQELLKGSLQTFLNAMTYPDKTVYPVSSQVETDFFNLVDVYCDAVLHPLLSRNTLSQEGWHFDVEDPYGPVNIKGIVYNEMKGVFSDFSSHVARKVMGGLFPDTTYSFESGGEPEHITDLTYEEFRDFHSKYYHPSNSFIFLYGNIPTEKTLKFLEENYLHEYQRLEIDPAIRPQALWDKPRRMAIEAPAPREEDGTATVNVSWILGGGVDPINVLTGQILSGYLLGAESSPLKRALIDSGLGEDLDNISGFDADLIQCVFGVGLRKTQPEYAEKIKTLIIDTLKKEVENELDEDLLEGSIRRMEFKLREISGGYYPYNLKLADRCYRSWIYGGDPLAHLKFEESLSLIKTEKARGHGYFVEAIKKNLLENPHHLLSVITASSEMGKRLERQTEEQAKRLTRDFGQKEKRKYHKLTLNLLERQKTPSAPEDLAKLPRLSKCDLPPQGRKIPTQKDIHGEVPLFIHPLFTSGVVYLDFGFDCGVLPADQIPWLPLYAELLARCGAQGLSYEAMSKRVSLSTGGLSASVLCEPLASNSSDLLFRFFLHGKALPERVPETMEIFSDLFIDPELSNVKLIKDIIFEMRNDLNAAAISSGHGFAMAHAASRLTPSGFLNESLNGISQLRFLNSLLKKEAMDETAQKLRALHSCLINKRTCIVSLTADDPNASIPFVKDILNRLPTLEVNPVTPPSPPRNTAVAHGIEISASVNFVAKAWRLSEMTPHEAGQLQLLAKNLSTGYLWDKVRVEGGAYGGMAVASSTHPVFTCASYRDPNLAGTLRHFESGLKSVADGLPTEKIEQNIISAIGVIDKPKPPQAQGFSETLALMSGRTPEFRQSLRDSVLQTTTHTLKEVAEKVLASPETSITALGSEAAFDGAAREGCPFERESLLGN